jgi:hypothetical protein
MNFRERDWSGKDWVDLAKDRDLSKDLINLLVI